jgi:YHS domain-containing protein
MRLTLKALLKTLILMLGLSNAAVATAAVDPVYTGFFSNEAIDGYDAVAYFTEGKPVEGSDAFQFEYQGAVWKFSSQEHLDMFRADPTAYAPQYGGYCAFAVANGDTASAEPDLWTIHEGKLYLNYNRRINERFRNDIEAFIQQADQNWPEIEKK